MIDETKTSLDGPSTCSMASNGLEEVKQKLVEEKDGEWRWRGKKQMKMTLCRDIMT